MSLFFQRRFVLARGKRRAMKSRVNREVQARLCVQRRLACSAGDKPAGARVRSPVAWIAGEGNRISEAYRRSSPWETRKSSGRNENERGCGLENEEIRGPSSQP